MEERSRNTPRGSALDDFDALGGWEDEMSMGGGESEGKGGEMGSQLGGEEETKVLNLDLTGAGVVNAETSDGMR